ncbi:hypothetical protein EDD18DRAFT_1102692 [Armillaria luteobubalina]|uniref:Uncharacterized protein n=1 Tax=Armillaria luteobubalina TaxID=153913 RepID=A0AA39QAI9_9AGAR|nr:hypothetical protein EDD18DRAFT_1102692 [Armillaria luteobubalina]
MSFQVSIPHTWGYLLSMALSPKNDHHGACSAYAQIFTGIVARPQWYSLRLSEINSAVLQSSVEIAPSTNGYRQILPMRSINPKWISSDMYCSTLMRWWYPDVQDLEREHYVYEWLSECPPLSAHVGSTVSNEDMDMDNQVAGILPTEGSSNALDGITSEPSSDATGSLDTGLMRLLIVADTGDLPPHPTSICDLGFLTAIPMAGM